MPQPYHLLPKIGSSLAEEWLDIGLNHHVAGRFAEAEQAYFKGLRIDPNSGPILNNLGIGSAQQNQMVLALQRLERATLFDKDNAAFQSTAWYNYAFALLEVDRTDEARTAIEHSIKLGESADAFCAHGMILTSCGFAAEAEQAYDKALSLIPNHPMGAYNTVFVRTLKNTTPEENYKARKFWYEQNRYKGEIKPHDSVRDPERPLRVGYVGGDFKMHSASFIWRTPLVNHTDAIEPYCYMAMAADPNSDTSTKLFMEKTTWRDISALDDEAAEKLIRQDKIDILIDLAGHTGGNRLALFTRKPAPIQCHAWGFAHGSGCPEIDYFLADSYAIPEAERQYFAEKIWDLPTIIGYTPPSEYNQPGVSYAPVTRDGIFTFGVFGRFEKYSPQSLEAWHKILLRTPNSRLMIKDRMMRAPYAIRHIREIMHDIDPKRVLFAMDCPHPEQLLAYQNVDLVLDTFPHTGGVTALEILYMGVPVVTLYNGQVGGRTTSVALKAMGRKNWIADSINDYVNKAVKLASERAELSEARTKLREELLRSPICTGYAEAVERAYRQMWWKYCGKEVVPAARRNDIPIAETPPPRKKEARS